MAIATAAVTSPQRAQAALYHRVPLLLTGAGAVGGVQVHRDAFFSSTQTFRDFCLSAPGAAINRETRHRQLRRMPRRP